MFEFFIALFGGLFYTSKLLSDKSKINDAERSFNEGVELDKVIRKEVETSADVVESIRRKVYKTTFADMKDELKDDLIFVYGENYESVCKGISNYWACNLLLSHIGKVDWDAFAYGFQLGGEKTVAEDIRFCQRIEQNLNNNGIGLKLYLKPKYSTYTKSYDYNPCAKHMVFEHKLFNKSLGKRLW